MTSEPQRGEHDQEPRRGWDYSTHPLKAGGTQIYAVVVGTVLLLVLGTILLVWVLMKLPVAGVVK